MGERPANAGGDDLGGLHVHVGEIDHPEDDGLGGQLLEHREIELGLGGLDRDLLGGRALELGEERIAGRLVVHHGGIAEAEMDRDGAADAGERPVERIEPVGARLVGKLLHPRLVDLDDVGTRREQVLDLGIDGVGEIHRHRGRVAVMVVLGLAAHGERPRHRRLDLAVGVGAQQRDVAHLDRVAPPDLADDARHRHLAARCGSWRARDCRCRRLRARWRSDWNSFRAAARRRVTMSRPARSWSRIASSVASSCAASRCSSPTSQRSRARTRGTCFDSLARSISHSGCG